MQWLVEGARPGDALFFHFSGHGGQIVDTHGDEEDGMDETICPVDFEQAGQISDDELFARLAAPLPAGCRLTVLLDCCHSGHGMDFPYTLHDGCCHSGHAGLAWAVDGHFQRSAQADVLLFSGCEDDQCSADASCRAGRPAGAMTSAFVELLGDALGDTGHTRTYGSLLRDLTRVLDARGFEQLPQISSTQPFALSRVVALDDVAAGASATAGTVVRLPRRPCERREVDGGFGQMMLASLAMQAAMHTGGHGHGHGATPGGEGAGRDAGRAEGGSFAADAGKPSVPTLAPKAAAADSHTVVEESEEESEEESQEDEEDEENEEGENYSYDDDDGGDW